jgi:hypothetical protein
MHIDEATDSQVKTIIRDTITNCGGTPKDMDLDICSTLVEDVVGKMVAGRCVEIATGLVPGTERNRTWEEISHGIGREMLGWAGM